MTTFKSSEQTLLCSLLFQTTTNYNTNLQTLLTLIDETPPNSIIVAPEVCLTGFDYDNFQEAWEFTYKANIEIKKVSSNKIIILTMIEKIGDDVFNMAKIFYNGKVIHERAKAKLFRFGGEHKHFVEGDEEEVGVVEVDGIKIALLICFELRFKKLWQMVEGADVICIPAMWGVLRTEHFNALINSLAIMNQCYVVASDSLNEDCSKQSAIITPQGKVTKNGSQALLKLPYEQKEIMLMRRYLDVGIG